MIFKETSKTDEIIRVAIRARESTCAETVQMGFQLIDLYLKWRVEDES